MTKDEALKLAMEAMEITGGFDVEILSIKEALAEQDSKDKEQAKTDSFVRQLDEALAQPWEKFCDSNCVWTDHHPDCKLAEQKPVAWLIDDDYTTVFHDIAEVHRRKGANVLPLYTTPPPVAEPHKRKPLTDEQIGDEFVRFQVGGMFTPFLYAVRAIEAAHGIKGEA